MHTSTVRIVLPIERLLGALDAVRGDNLKNTSQPRDFFVGLEDGRMTVETFHHADHVVRSFCIPRETAWPSDLPRAWRVATGLVPILRAAKTGLEGPYLVLLFTRNELRLESPDGVDLQVSFPIEPRGALRPRAPYEKPPATLHAGLLYNALHAVIHAMSFERDWSARLYVRAVSGGTELLAMRPHGAARVVMPAVFPEVQVGYTSVKRLFDLTAKRPFLETLTAGRTEHKDPVLRIESITDEGLRVVETEIPVPLPRPDTTTIFDPAYECGARLELDALTRALTTVQRIGSQDPLRDLLTLEFHNGRGVSVSHLDGAVRFTKFVPCAVDGDAKVRIRGEALARALRPLQGVGGVLFDPKGDRLWIEAPFGGLTAHTAVVSTLRDTRSIT